MSGRTRVHAPVRGNIPVALLLVVMLIFLAGCTGADPTPDSASDTAPEHSSPPGVSLTTRGGAVPDELQGEILLDGSVTHEEMEHALLAVVDCVRDAGYNAELRYFRPRVGWGLGVWSQDPDEVERADERHDYCSARLVDELSDIYFDQHGLNQVERAARDEMLVDCLTDRGNDTAGLTLDEALQRSDLDGREECERLADESVPPG